MILYMVELYDSLEERDYYEGYFTDESKAQTCCTYMNRIKPHKYNRWKVVKHELSEDTTDYNALIKELDEKERIEREKIEEDIKRRELAELARLKAKYESGDN